MHFERTYDLSDTDAIARMRALTDYWSKKHGVRAVWEGEQVCKVALSGKVKGVKFDGTVQVGQGRIVAEVNAGFLAEKLGGRAYVSRKLDDYLDPKRSLESLQARVPR